MIVHAVFFRPKSDLPVDDAARLVASFEKALAGIPSIRRALVGRRITIDREYEKRMHSDFPYAAILEFDDEAGLQSYLNHPAHADLGTAIFTAAADILVHDFEMEAGQAGVRTIAARL